MSDYTVNVRDASRNFALVKSQSGFTSWQEAEKHMDELQKKYATHPQYMVTIAAGASK